MPGQIGKYQIERELGRGGFGKVYLAFDPDVGQPVAIKKLLAEGDVDLLKRFQMEIRTTAALRHKNIVTIHASGEDGGDPYLVMEFLEGQTLKQIIQERRPLTLLEKVRIMTQVAEGLGYANSKGVVHRDVKPENIMLLADDTVKIMDFGIALGPNRSSAVTQTGGIIGTPPYFAPEQLQGYKASEQTDIFSFGDVYYELLTGVHPFEQYRDDWKSLQIAIMSYEPRSIGDLLPGCPEALETLVHRALAKEAEFRYQKFEEIKLDSEAIMVDLRQEGAALILREVASLEETGDLHAALSKINRAYQLAPGNREVRRRRDEINLLLQKQQIRTRVSRLLEESDKHMGEGRYAEAVQSLESAARLDTGNMALEARLSEARNRHDSYVRANRLVSEARLRQQKGLLAEADDRLQEALAIDPDHTEARRLSHRIRGEMERRRLAQQRQVAIRAARDHLAAKRYEEALAVLAAAEKELAEAADLADLRAEIQHEQAEETRRQRAEKFNLALAKTRETIEAGDLERAQRMLDHLDANFAAEPGAAEALRGLRDRLEALVRTREVAQYQQNARALLKEKSFREALDLLAEARRKFPGESGLERLNASAEELHRAHQRAEAIAAVLKEATSRRDGGDLEGALDTILKGRRNLGDEAAFVDLARQLEIEIEQQRYTAALESLLKAGRELLAAGRYSEAIARLEKFSGEAEVRVLLDSARAALAIEEERRYAEQTLAAAGKLESEGAWAQALGAVERGLAQYPHNSSLTQSAARLRDRVEMERRRSSIESRRAAIRANIQGGEWKSAAAALSQARAEFPGERAFDDLAEQVESGSYEDGWREVEAGVNRHLAANALSQAQAHLERQVTRTVYAGDPRWKALAEEVARRQGYEEALREADRRRNAGRFSEAEDLLTEVINQGPPDKRADQMRGAIQVQRSELSRQEGIARIAREIRQRLGADDLALADSHLARARARYPGESVWGELQAELDSKQQAVRRKADAAAAEESIRKSLERGDTRQAAAALNTARAKYPAEAAWGNLEVEINARQAALQRQDEIAAAAERVRQWRGRAPAGTADPAALLRQRREDLRPALAELDAARARYPGEALWDTLRAEIDARRAFLDAESEIVKRLSQSSEQGDLAAAQAQLASARAAYPDEDLWGLFLTEIGRREELLKARAEIARLTNAVRERLTRGDLRGAAAELAPARARYPQESAWAALQSEIDAREKALEREAAMARIAESLRSRLDHGIRDARKAEPEAPQPAYPIAQVWDVLRDATARLEQARATYPGESLWTNLAAEIAERQARVENEIVETVRSCAGLAPLDWNARQLAAARVRYPGESFWTPLQSEIDSRREPLERASMAEFEGRVRECLKQDDPRAALDRLNAARKRHPGAGVWDQLQTDIDACRARIERREALDAMERSVREQLRRVGQIPKEADWADPVVLQWEAFRKAAGVVAEARAKYPGDERLAALAAETAARQAEWQRQTAQGISDSLGKYPHQEVVKWFGPQVRALRAKDPKEGVWARLDGEIAAVEALLKRQAEVAAAGERVRECLRRDDTRQAAAQLDAARAKYSADPLWSTLQGEIDARQAEVEEARGRAASLFAQGRAEEAIAVIETRFAHHPDFAEMLTRARQAIEEQKRREERERALNRLSAIEREAGAETHRRRRKELDREAQRLAADRVEDRELAAIAARIHALVETTAPPKPIPWKPIGIGVGALAAVATVVLLWPHKKPPEKGATTIPIEIRTDPPGAQLSIGDRSCVTNCRLDLAPGTYRVDAELKGYAPGQQTVVVDSSHRLVDLTLAPEPAPPPGGARPQDARLELRGAPAKVELRLDGKLLGRTDGSSPFALPVKPGDGTLEVSSGVLQVGQQPGARSIRQKFEPGQTVRLAWNSGAVPRKDGGGGTVVVPGIAPGTTTPAVTGPAAGGGATGGTPTGTTAGTTTGGTPPPPKEDPEQRDWDRLANASSADQLRNFIRTYPSGKHAKEAQASLDGLVWSNTKDNLDLLRAYVKEFPNGAHRGDALSHIDDLTWKAVDQNDATAVQKFRNENPSSRHLGEAQAILDRIAKTKVDAEKKAVGAVVDQFNAAFARANKREMTALWPDAPNSFLNSMSVAHAVFKLTLQSIEIQGDTATISGNAVTGNGRTQSTKITMQKRANGWVITTLSANR